MWVNFTDEEAEALELFLVTGLIKDRAMYENLGARIAAEQARLKTPEHRALWAAAAQAYGEVGDRREISVDADAAVSVADTHTFVQAWVMVPITPLKATSMQHQDERVEAYIAEEDAAIRKLHDAVAAVPPLPRCRHGQALQDHAGERLEPPCGCRATPVITEFMAEHPLALSLNPCADISIAHPKHTVPCAACGKPACTIEKCGEPGHQNSCQLADKSWVCTKVCWDIAAEIAEIPPLALARAFWESGFSLCRSYRDNWPHFQGEQKERDWRRLLLDAIRTPSIIGLPQSGEAATQ